MPIYHLIEPRTARRNAKEWRLRAMRLCAMLGGIIFFCAAGLFLFDSTHDPLSTRILRSIWDSANLVSTLGDFSNFDEGQKAFMLFVMVGVLVVAGYALTSLSGLVSGEAIMIRRENKLMKKLLENTSDHVIVMGFGELGRLVAEHLKKAGDTPVVIERNGDLAAKASELGYMVVVGDAGADDDLFGEAAIDRAKALIVTSDDADRNLVVTLMAHAANPKLKIAVTGESRQRGSLLHRAGASEVVIADALIAAELVGRLSKKSSS